MSSINNYIDTSLKSLGISFVVFIIITLASKYVFDLYNKDKKDEEKRSMYMTYLYSVLIGLICALLSLVLFKKITKSSNDILTEPFPSKI